LIDPWSHVNTDTLATRAFRAQISFDRGSATSIPRDIIDAGRVQVEPFAHVLNRESKVLIPGS